MFRSDGVVSAAYPPSPLCSIFIEGRCRYDFRRETIVHNAGPYSDNSCCHPRFGISEEELVENTKSKYAVQIEKAKEELNRLEKDVLPPINEKIEQSIAANIKEVRLENVGYLWEILELPTKALDNNWNLAVDAGDEVWLVKEPVSGYVGMKYW